MTMLAPVAQRPLFPFVADGHPFAPAIERFRERVAERSDALAWRGDPRTIVHTELKGAAQPAGGFAIDRMYCSLQRVDDGFTALSLCFAAKHGRTDWYAFPDEPYLAGLRPFVEGDALVARDGVPAFDVLRYVPLRRFTFRGRLQTRPGREVVGKFKRASRVHEAHARAVAIARAVAAAGRPFAVPAPLGIDAEHRICFQGIVPGRPLSELVTRAADVAEGGALQRAFHRLPARDVPAWDQAAFVAGIARDVAWIAFLRPDSEPVLERVRRALARMPAPLDPADLACCHGDWVCSHLYRSQGGWAVIDLDLARRADPLWEVAMALAALARDVPLLEAVRSDPGADARTVLQRSEDAWVDGYRSASGEPVDERRLGYWRLCAEIYELALMLSKDRYEPVAFGRSLALAGELADRLMGEGT
jgi:phosphotransferase family enzyme